MAWLYFIAGVAVGVASVVGFVFWAAWQKVKGVREDK